MTTFVLVHGAWHGAWCWERLVPELEQRGHAALAVDLPVDDAAAGLAEYATVVEQELPAGEVVLVGHSLGATVIPLVAAARPVSQLVFLCPVLRRPGSSLADQAALDADVSSWDLGAGRTFYDDESSAWTAADAAIAAFYQDCDPETARWAASRLRRQYWRYWEEPNPLAAWPDVERRAIVCQDDRLVDIGWARRTLPAELGVTPAELPGGHSPFLSRPAALAETLIARR
ncbi:MAG TPA: alpha/beta hydrolase [Candidatus Limnocylindria bacterium]|jgi:pimeloyl-ACP methyl ester carboxylesterase|nr:alpha/beta hydrolase [Candidatus Limnocylindria bacterium]